MSLSSLNQAIEQFLAPMQIDHLGYADLSGHPEAIQDYYGPLWNDYPRAISLGVNMPNRVVDELLKAPNHTYLYYYDVVNAKINQIVLALTNWLENQGWLAYPVPASQRTNEDKLSGIFSHRLAARLAGLGWIGKSCSLITERNGPRLRLGTILTDAPLDCGSPLESKCGSCTLCRDKCPPKAIKGRLWQENQAISERLDVFACDNHLQETRKAFGKRICGICIAVCPYGRNQQEGKEE